jgi:hypothetical protein
VILRVVQRGRLIDSSGLLGCGVRSQMHVQCKFGNDALVTGSHAKVGRFVAMLSYLVDSLPAFLPVAWKGNYILSSNFT